MLYNFVSRVLHDGLLALGAFLIYREWREDSLEPA